MDFARFRSLAGWTLEDAANRLKDTGDDRFAGVNASVVSKHERGARFPNPDLIERYAEITDGAVTFSDWNEARKAALEARRAEEAA